MQRVWKVAGIALIAIGVIPYIIGQTALADFWPFTAIAVTAGLFLWGAASGMLERVSRNISGALGHQPTRGIGLGLVITPFFAVAMAFAFFWLLPFVQRETGIEHRFAWVMVIVVGLLVIVPLVRLYKVTGIPFDPENLRKGTWGIALLVIAVFAIITYDEPNRFFDQNTGRPVFMVDEAVGKPVYRDPRECREQGGCYSPFNGERLRPGTPADVERFKKAPWPDRLFSFFEGEEAKKARAAGAKSAGPVVRTMIAPKDKYASVKIPLGKCILWETEEPEADDLIVKYDDHGQGTMLPYRGGSPDMWQVHFRSKVAEPREVRLYFAPLNSRACNA